MKNKLNELAEVSNFVVKLQIQGYEKEAKVFSLCRTWKEVEQKKFQLEVLNKIK